MDCLSLTFELLLLSSEVEDGERLLLFLRVLSRDAFLDTTPSLGRERSDEDEVPLDREEEEELRLLRFLLRLFRLRPRWEEEDDDDVLESLDDEDPDELDEDSELLSELLDEVDEDTDESSSFFPARASC